MKLIDFLQHFVGEDSSAVKEEIAKGKVKINNMQAESHLINLTSEYRIPSIVEYKGKSYSFYSMK